MYYLLTCFKDLMQRSIFPALGNKDVSGYICLIPISPNRERNAALNSLLHSKERRKKYVTRGYNIVADGKVCHLHQDFYYVNTHPLSERKYR